MTNIYLEKAASIYDFWNDFTGREHSDLKARKYHLEKALANKDTVEGLASKVRETGARTFNARMKVGAGVAGLAAAGAYGAHKYREHQDQKAVENLRTIFQLQKQAKLINSSTPVSSSFARALKETGRSVKDLINSAHGGKVDEYAYNKFGGNTPKFQKFQRKSEKVQSRYVRRNFGQGEAQKLQKLYDRKRSAQMRVYGTLAGGVAAYKSGQNSGRKETRSYY